MNKILSNYSQPYLYEETNINLLCCFADSLIEDYFDHHQYFIKPWKIHLFKNINVDNASSIRLDLPCYIEGYGYVLIECNPCVYKNSNIMTYTCGFKMNPRSAVRYYFVKVEIDNNSYKNFQILSQAFNAIIIDDYIYQISKDKHCIEVLSLNTLEQINSYTIVEEEMSSINRISRVYNSNDLILTIATPTSESSMLVDINMDIKKMLKDSDTNIYKCSLYKNYLAYTIKDSNDIQEKRSIKIIDNYTI